MFQILALYSCNCKNEVQLNFDIVTDIHDFCLSDRFMKFNESKLLFCATNVNCDNFDLTIFKIVTYTLPKTFAND